ncbi:hypothetical protein CSV79_01505 [Sporosarcina sp. P13]|uniref:hypothetical protein n=1 Tax=Sporosarcina sp. P13 TaxID=2048263 RepID=UPI000C163BFC|nr:hypothetical protein [Sporosarcina sp. P13]PIC65326.1 hypothetical protein CSV79_01505 [Sporosarcina sp. P13]
MKILFIHDNEGVILSQQSGHPAPRLPVGVPYIYEEIPEGKRVTGVDVSVTPCKLILEDIPSSEIDQLKQTVADLTEIVLSGGI